MALRRPPAVALFSWVNAISIRNARHPGRALGSMELQIQPTAYKHLRRVVRATGVEKALSQEPAVEEGARLAPQGSMCGFPHRSAEMETPISPRAVLCPSRPSPGLSIDRSSNISPIASDDPLDRLEHML